MMRGGHLDICVLGAFQVSATGDLANWHTGAPDAIPAVGGAMDLAIGAKQTWVMMDTAPRQGEQQDRRALQLPAHRHRLREAHLHRPGRDRRGLEVVDMVDGLDLDGLRRLTGVPLRLASST
jgi:3-oxoadipate CoA-transferase beta subunit